VGVREAVNPHITFSPHFSEFEAAVAAGATLDELMRLEEYPKMFRAKLVAWFGYHKLLELHTQDAVNRRPKAKK
jgi:hypothetical protein